MSILNTTAPTRSKDKGDVAVGRTGRMAVSDSGKAVTLFQNTSNSDFEPIVVNLNTGDRLMSGAKTGSLSSGRDSNGRIVASIPGTEQFVVAFNGALHIWDSATGNSYVLSR